MYPNSFKNLPSVESRLKYSPLGIVKGRTKLLNIFPDILKGKISGRILVDVNK